MLSSAYLPGCRWRRDPEHQGGFLLDAGVHFVAGLRLLLGPIHTIKWASARTSLTTPEQGQLDTILAKLETSTGLPGRLSICFASKEEVSKWILRFEHGEMEVSRKAINIKGQKLEFVDQGRAVPEELVAWGCGIMTHQEDWRCCIKEALADLE